MFFFLLGMLTKASFTVYHKSEYTPHISAKILV